MNNLLLDFTFIYANSSCVLQEIQPTLSQLGISTPEEMGYDKPELALESVYDQ